MLFRSAARAETITRTECGRVLEMASQARMTAAAEVVPGLQKQWRHGTVTRMPRAMHLAADGQIRDVDKPFNVGGEELMYPRDPAGSAGNTINCGCYSVPYHPDWGKPTEKEAPAKEKKAPKKAAVLTPERYIDLERSIIRGWQDSMETGGAQLLQKTVNAEFLKGKGFIYSEGLLKRAIQPKAMKEGKIFVRQMYERTQADFAKESITKIKLYRGIQGQVNVDSVISSWTTDRKIAEKFDGYKVLEKEIDAKNILTHHGNWMKNLHPEEKEYIVISR